MRKEVERAAAKTRYELLTQLLWTPAELPWTAPRLPWIASAIDYGTGSRV